MSREEILMEIVKLSQLLEDIRLGIRPASSSEELGYRDDLRALRERLRLAPSIRAEQVFHLDS